MSIDKRGPNKFRFRKTYKGTTYTRTFYGSQKDVKKEHDKFINDVQNGKLDKTKNKTFEELVQTVWDVHIVKNLAPNTRMSYKFWLDLFLEKFGSRDAMSISVVEVEKFFNQLSKDHKASSIKIAITIFLLIYNKAVSWRIIERNPFTGILRRKSYASPKNNMGELLSAEQIGILMNAYRNENIYQRTGAYLALGCGLRKSEIRALKTTDIDFETNKITVSTQIANIEKNGKIIEGEKNPKDESQRVVIAPDFVIETIRELIKEREVISKDRYIFYNPSTKKPVSSAYFRNALAKVVIENNLPKITFHDLRHLHATLLINQGTDIHSVAKRLGHKTISTTINTYIHGINEKDKMIAEDLDKRLKEIEKKI